MVKGILKFRVLCHPVEAVSIVLLLERRTVILAKHTNQRNMLPTDDFLHNDGWIRIRTQFFLKD